MVREASYNLVNESPELLAPDPADEPLLHSDIPSNHRHPGSLVRSPVLCVAFVALLLLTFLSGSVLQPVSLSGLRQGNCPHQPDHVRLRAFMPSCKKKGPRGRGKAASSLLTCCMDSVVRDEGIRIQPDIRQ
jgi:hypothetical protein